MLKISAVLTDDNHIRLPDEVLRHLGVGERQHVVFVIDEDQGTVVLCPPDFPYLTLEETFGSVPAIPGASDDFDVEIEEAISDYVDAKMERLANQRR